MAAVGYNDAGTWRNSQQVSVNSGGTWLALRSPSAYDSAWRTSYDLGYSNRTVGGSSASGSVFSTSKFSSAGALTHQASNLTTVNESWFTPQTAGVGSLYEIRFTLSSGDALDLANPAVGNWATLNEASPGKYIQQLNSGAGTTKTSVVLVEIRAQGGVPTNIISSQTITLVATKL